MSPPLFFGLLPSMSDLWFWAALLCLLYVVVKALKLYMKRRWLLKAFSQFDGPKRHWLYGNAHELHGDGKDIDILMRYAEKYPYAYPVWLGNFFAYLTICHPDYAKVILSRQGQVHCAVPGFGGAGSLWAPSMSHHMLLLSGRVDPKDDFGYYYLTPLIGKGLLVLSGQKWFQHRQLINPGFHYDVIKPYVKTMSDCVTVMLDKLERLPEENPVEIFRHVSLMTLDIIMRCAFSYPSNCQLDSENAYIKAVCELFSLVNYRFFFFPYHNDLIFHLSPHGFRFRRALRIAHEHTDKVFKERKEFLKKDTGLEKIQKKRHLDFLDILLSAKLENGQGLSDEDLKGEVDTFMVVGHDTSATAISWILYCLAKYPEHQEKCREEIREVLKEKTTIEWEDLNKLPYTTMCIKESMRLYPPVPGVARELKEPITFCDGRSLPKGVDVYISLYAINRCSSIWENPEVFDPLRFSPENVSNRYSHAFIPFSAGGRNCIGKNFAMNEMKVVIALTLQRFELCTVPGKEPLINLQVILHSFKGIYLYLKKIDCDKRKKYLI